jgi:D-cysteine desulfhydrase
VEAALELAEQVEAGLLPAPDRIYVAVSTGGTFCGLWLGARLAGLRSEVVGVRVVDRILANGPRLRALAAGAATRLARAAYPRGPLLRALSGPMRLVHKQVGRGYGWSTSAAEAALSRLRAHGGPLLETTYTAKAFAALIEEAEAASRASPGAKFLFWNTFNQLPFDNLVAQTPFAHLPLAYRRALGGA